MSAALTKLGRQFSPALPPLEILPRLVAILSNELAIPLVPDSKQAIGRFDRAVRSILKKTLDLPEIPVRQSPVVRIEHSQIENAISLDPPGVIHVTLRVALSESSRCLENRLASMKPGIT